MAARPFHICHPQKRGLTPHHHLQQVPPGLSMGADWLLHQLPTYLSVSKAIHWPMPPTLFVGSHQQQAQF